MRDTQDLPRVTSVRFSRSRVSAVDDCAGTVQDVLLEALTPVLVRSIALPMAPRSDTRTYPDTQLKVAKHWRTSRQWHPSTVPGHALDTCAGVLLVRHTWPRFARPCHPDKKTRTSLIEAA